MCSDIERVCAELSRALASAAVNIIRRPRGAAAGGSRPANPKTKRNVIRFDAHEGGASQVPCFLSRSVDGLIQGNRLHS